MEKTSINPWIDLSRMGSFSHLMRWQYTQATWDVSNKFIFTIDTITQTHITLSHIFQNMIVWECFVAVESENRIKWEIKTLSCRMEMEIVCFRKFNKWNQSVRVFSMCLFNSMVKFCFYSNYYFRCIKNTLNHSNAFALFSFQWGKIYTKNSFTHSFSFRG